MCNRTTAATSNNRADSVLLMYRNSHEAVARYTVYLSTGIDKPCQDIKTRLPYAEARALRDQLNDSRERVSFGGPIYGIRLKNPDEALAAVRKASRAFWLAKAGG